APNRASAARTSPGTWSTSPARWPASACAPRASAPCVTCTRATSTATSTPSPWASRSSPRPRCWTRCADERPWVGLGPAVVGDLVVEDLHGPAQCRHALLQGGPALAQEGDPVLRGTVGAQDGHELPQVRDAEAGVPQARSEERRVGKEWRPGWARQPGRTRRT